MTNDGTRHPEERSDVGIYLCEGTERQRKIATGLRTLAMTNNGSRHPEERSDVGIYLCQVTERQRKIDLWSSLLRQGITNKFVLLSA